MTYIAFLLVTVMFISKRNRNREEILEIFSLENEYSAGPKNSCSCRKDGMMILLITTEDVFAFQ